jgi:hypothetical protein
MAGPGRHQQQTRPAEEARATHDFAGVNIGGDHRGHEAVTAFVHVDRVECVRP